MTDFIDLFSIENIFTDVEATSKEDALKLLSDKLVENGNVVDGYYDMLIAREEQFPTGLATEPFEVAIPHTDPSLVLRPCIAVLKLKNPVQFTEMTKNGEVQARYIFCLVLKKSEKQIPFLQKFVGIFSDHERMDCLDRATSPEEILEVFRNC